MSPSEFDAIVLADDDHVATALRHIRAGDTVKVRLASGARELLAREDVALCHKLAVTDIAPGAPIRKYGEVIGEATTAIEAGAHVHVHNLRSRRARR